MTELFSKHALVGTAILGSVVLAFFALSRPWYFTTPSNLLYLILLEFLLVAIWMYRRVFFPIVLFSFLMAGLNLPIGPGPWSAVRWVSLAAGALVGAFIVLKEHSHHFGLIHVSAAFAVLTGVVSAAVSHYPSIALLKVLSLFLLFLYCSTGARLAVTGREIRFFNGLLLGIEIFVAANGILYAIGFEPMGNPNSLGAVMGVAAAPILLWGILQGGTRGLQGRRMLLYTICIFLILLSKSRAGMAAGFIASLLMCLALRKYRLILKASIIVVILGSLVGLYRPELFGATFSSVAYKGGAMDGGILASRLSPWQTALDNIKGHPWFGVGFGTTATGEDPGEKLGKFSSSSQVTTENGSSYLALASGIGLLGLPPFALLLALLLGKILRTLRWMWASRNASHAAIPLAFVVFAGIVHAAFEDWMFAPGYYLCVFFWGMAFIFDDLVPSPSLAGLVPHKRSHAIRQSAGAVALH